MYHMLQLSTDSANTYIEDKFAKVYTLKGTQDRNLVVFEIDDPKRRFSISKEELLQVLSIK
jgi:hypothetical protein